SHKGAPLPQIETYAEDNVLSRGQEIAVEGDEAKAVDLVLRPGEMSLHHIGIVHGSNPNTSTKPRIGIAVRYIATDVVQDGAQRQFAMLVRGKDEFGHFDLLELPQGNGPSSNRHLEVLGRLRANLMPQDKQNTPKR